jgi:hypothetical protein
MPELRSANSAAFPNKRDEKFCGNYHVNMTVHHRLSREDLQFSWKIDNLVADPEFGKLQGHTLIVSNALYGLSFQVRCGINNSLIGSKGKASNHQKPTHLYG